MLKFRLELINNNDYDDNNNDLLIKTLNKITKFNYHCTDNNGDDKENKEDDGIDNDNIYDIYIYKVAVCVCPDVCVSRFLSHGP